MSTGPVESKVKAASGAAVVGGLIVWALEQYVFGGDVPDPVEAVIYLAVPAITAFLGGFMARHTFRNDPDAVNAQAGPPSI